MTGNTHLAAGLAAGMIYADVLMYNTSHVGLSQLGMCAAAVGAAAIGSLAPDIDLKTSKAGHAARPVSTVASLFGHRTIFHSPLMLILIYYACTVFVPIDYAWLYEAFIAGAVSHLFLDMLNRKGIPVFYPIPRKFHISTIKTGSRRETGVMIIMYMVFAAALTAFVVLVYPHIRI